VLRFSIFSHNFTEGRSHRGQLVEEKLGDAEGDKICFKQTPKRTIAPG
jgi:hypothetical protein